MVLAFFESCQRTKAPQKLISAAVPIRESMLVGGPNYVLNFINGEVDMVFFIPFKNFFTRLFFCETEEPEF